MLFNVTDEEDNRKSFIRSISGSHLTHNTRYELKELYSFFDESRVFRFGSCSSVFSFYSALDSFFESYSQINSRVPQSPGESAVESKSSSFSSLSLFHSSHSLCLSSSISVKRNGFTTSSSRDHLRFFQSFQARHV